MAVSKSGLRRALLYVPGSSQKMLDKSRGLTVDCVAYDLEDSVTINKKAEARANIRKLLQQDRASGINEYAVRINAIGSGFEADDLAEVVCVLDQPVEDFVDILQCLAPRLNTIVIPKVNSASDLQWADHFINDKRSSAKTLDGSPLRPLSILALIESAKALADLNEICRSSSSLAGLIFAAEDFALDLSITRTPSLTEFLYARSAIATAARAHNLQSTIDLVCTSFRGEEGRKVMEEECLGGKGIGFNGKQCIHPDQVPIAQKVFAPSDDEVTWAVRIVVANEKADKAGRGAWTMDGKMIDAPVVGKARAIVEKAEACGLAIDDLRQIWRGQEPE